MYEENWMEKLLEAKSSNPLDYGEVYAVNPRNGIIVKIKEDSFSTDRTKNEFAFVGNMAELCLDKSPGSNTSDNFDSIKRIFLLDKDNYFITLYSSLIQKAAYTYRPDSPVEQLIIFSSLAVLRGKWLYQVENYNLIPVVEKRFKLSDANGSFMEVADSDTINISSSFIVSGNENNLSRREFVIRDNSSKGKSVSKIDNNSYCFIDSVATITGLSGISFDSTIIYTDVKNNKFELHNPKDRNNSNVIGNSRYFIPLTHEIKINGDIEKVIKYCIKNERNGQLRGIINRVNSQQDTIDFDIFTVIAAMDGLAKHSKGIAIIRQQNTSLTLFKRILYAIRDEKYYSSDSTKNNTKAVMDYVKQAGLLSKENGFNILLDDSKVDICLNIRHTVAHSLPFTYGREEYLLIMGAFEEFRLVLFYSILLLAGLNELQAKEYSKNWPKYN